MRTGNGGVRTRRQLIKEIADTSGDLFVRMMSVTVAHWLSLELTFAQGKALILLAAHGAVTVSRLGRKLGVSNPTASILVQHLVDRGLVTRTEDAADRRQTVVQLSAEGREIGEGHIRERTEKWRRWLSRLSDDELAALARGMSALKEAVRAEAGTTAEEALSRPARS